MEVSTLETKTPVSTPSLKKLFSPTPLKENVNMLQQETNQMASEQPYILPLAEALEHAQKNGLPKQRRIRLPSSKRKSMLRPTKLARETIHTTTEEAIQATIERIRPRHKRILSLIASRDPMETITAEEFWSTETRVTENKEPTDDSPMKYATTSPLHSRNMQLVVHRESDQVEIDDDHWVSQKNATTTPCTVQVDFDIPHTNEKDNDLSFSYMMAPPDDDDDDLYLQQHIPESHKHTYQIQHVAGLTVGCKSTDKDSHPSKRPKSANSIQKNTQSVGMRKTESRHGQPRELRFLPASREGDGLRQVGSGVRRSQRTRFPVLKFWKNETILYERRDSRQFPTIAGILAYPDTPQEEPKSRKRRRRRDGLSRSKTDREYPSGAETSESSSEASHSASVSNHNTTSIGCYESFSSDRSRSHFSQ